MREQKNKIKQKKKQFFPPKFRRWEGGERTDGETHFVMVPSMSEMTTRSVWFHMKMRAVHAIAPVAESENVIELAPGFSSRLFYIMFNNN